MPTIPHSGSMWLLKVLNQPRVTLRGEGDGTVFDHPYDAHMAYFERQFAQGFDMMIVPMRDPRDISIGWTKRRKGDRIDIWDQCWKNIDQIINRFDPIICPIDSPPIEDIEKITGPLDWDTPAQNTKPGAAVPELPYEDLYERWYVGQFYQR